MSEYSENLPAGEAETSNEAAEEALGSWDDLQVGFSGNPKTKMDDRGRLKMPAEFKQFIDKKYGKGFNAFYITSQDGQSAEIYPMPEWQTQLAKILKVPKGNLARKKLLDAYNLYGARVDMDPQGRLLLPEELRNEGVLVGEVKVSGEGNLLRVTSLQSLRQRVKANPISDQELDSLSGFDL
jgi:MraZ protein